MTEQGEVTLPVSIKVKVGDILEYQLQVAGGLAESRYVVKSSEDATAIYPDGTSE